MASRSDATADFRQLRQTGRTTVYGFQLFDELALEPAAMGLARLAGLVERGLLAPAIGVEAPWTRVGDVARQLLDRAFAGKAVLHIEVGPASAP